MGASKLFSAEQQQKIVDSIVSSELKSSAEVRVHIENRCKGDVLDRAVDVFGELKMDKTELKNGVLIYVAIKDHKTAIIGDQNINKLVKREFWDNAYNAMKVHFSKGEFTEGICAAIELLEGEFAEQFPYQQDDVNELPNDISFG